MHDEYQNLLTEFTSAVEDELLQYTRGLVLYGSYLKEQLEGPGWIIPGTSDLDLVLIVELEDINPEKHPRRLTKIGEALSLFFVHPVYAPILDLTLLEHEDLPPKLGMAFSPIHALSAQKGEVLLGKNILSDVSYSEKMLNRCAKVMINQSYETIMSSYLQRVIIGEMPLAHEYAEIVLDMAHATIASSGIFNIVRPEVPEKFDILMGDEDKIGSDAVDIVYEAKKWRMGSQKMNADEFLKGSLQFSQAVMQYIRNPFNK